MIYTALMLTDTGKAQWEKGYNSESNIEMNLVEDKKLKDQDGNEALGLCNQSLSSDGTNAKKTDKTMQIQIGVVNIRESLDNGKNKGLTLLEAIGATAGHEIEHTTEKNRDIGAQNLTFSFREIFSKEERRDRIERVPENIGIKIRQESRNNPHRMVDQLDIDMFLSF